MSCFVDGFPGEARIKKPTAKTPPRQGEAPTIEISALEVDGHSHSRDFLCSFPTIKKQNVIPLRAFHSFSSC